MGSRQYQQASSSNGPNVDQPLRLRPLAQIYEEEQVYEEEEMPPSPPAGNYGAPPPPPAGNATAPPPPAADNRAAPPPPAANFGAAAPPPAAANGEAPIPPAFERMVDAFVTALNQQPARAREEPRGDRDNTYAYIQRLGAVPFDGTGTPADADSWLRDLEKIYRLAGCDERRQVDYTIFLLRRDAQDWWETQEQVYEYPEELTWDDFSEAFRAQFIPGSYQIQKMNEFFNLKQGNSTVEEFDRRFRALVRYVPRMTNNELVLKNKFYEALNENVKFAVSGTNWPTYSELVQAAMRSEKALPRHLKGDGNQLRRPRDQPQNSMDRAPKRFNSGQNSGGQRTGTAARGTPRCFNCGIAGHVSRDCRRGPQGAGQQATAARGPGAPRQCYNCGQAGHISPNCPRRTQQGTGQQGRGQTGAIRQCFTCGQQGHMSFDCPNRTQQGGAGRGRGAGQVAAVGAPPAVGRGAPANRGRGAGGQPAAQGRVYAMTQTEAYATPEVVEGNDLIY